MITSVILHAEYVQISFKTHWGKEKYLAFLSNLFICLMVLFGSSLVVLHLNPEYKSPVADLL